MTRAMFVVVLSRMAGAVTDNAVDSGFADVPSGMWYTGAVAWAAKNGIVSGTGHNTFSPDMQITREQLAVLMVRFCEYMGAPLPAQQSSTAFTDFNSVSDYAKDAVQMCAAAGLLSGYTDGSFGPQKAAARAETAAICSRLQRKTAEGQSAGSSVQDDAENISDTAEKDTKKDQNSESEKDKNQGSTSGNRRPNTGGSGSGNVSQPDPYELILALEHPDLVSIDNRGKRITAVSGASVDDIKAQVAMKNPAIEFTLNVIDWLNEEKESGNNRDLLTTGDRLVISVNGQERVYTIDVPNREADSHYWDTATYNEILARVGANLPIFGSAVYDITSEKYADDLRTIEIDGEEVDDYTQVFREAIRECTRNGGGTVLVPAREKSYYTGSIQLDDNVNLHVEAGATVDFVPISTLEYYPRALVSYEGIDYYGYSTPIYAYQKKNVAVTGGGVIGVTDASKWAGDKEVLQRWNYSNTPVEMRDATADGNTMPPVLLQMYDCENVRISEITLGNAPFWTMNLVLCENVLIRGVETTSISSNSDGCDPESCRYVVIENCRFANKDDNIALKSGRGNNGKLRGQATEYVIIRGNEFYQGSGISIGSESAGGVNDIFVENNFYNGRVGDFNNPETGKKDLRARDAFRIKYANSMDAVFENIYFRNCAMGGFGDNLILIEYVSNDYMLSVTGQGTDSMSYVPVMRNIAMSNMFSVPNRFGEMDSLFRNDLVEAESEDLRPIDGLYLKDINLISSNCDPNERGVMKIHNVLDFHMDNVRVNGVELRAEERPIVITDVEVNGTALNHNDTTDVVSEGEDGTLVVTGTIQTEIENFESIGSVWVSYDEDPLRAEAEMVREGNAIRFTAELDGVGANEHDLAVVAKSNKLPGRYPDENAEREINFAPAIASNQYHIDVDGDFRAMDLEITFEPEAPQTHISPMLHIGEEVVVSVSAKDAKTGEAVTGFTLEATDKTNKGWVTLSVDDEAETVTVTAVKVNKGNNTNQEIILRVSQEGYATSAYTIYKLVVMPADESVQRILEKEETLPGIDGTQASENTVPDEDDLGNEAEGPGEGGSGDEAEGPGEGGSGDEAEGSGEGGSGDEAEGPGEGGSGDEAEGPGEGSSDDTAEKEDEGSTVKGLSENEIE